ncbi:MAG: response regulator [Nitrospinaceae bacterium]|nr:response regulator [Nitrospinaceae bacterium]NIR53673.1 response regulator [Nitrospinaceae bacterium]NIS84080.1 response regulator [Nitrospinaceae bacterium]NIT80884.1 response regulator [Nitrospinaceae bacterium]NIU43183.1 response regulator [Nitrospinaceae bacterium]
MSHELRTPMNAILGFAQIMNHDPEKILTRQYRENIYHILKAGQHLKLLIDEVLDLAVVESGKIELTLENLPIGPVIREIISQMEPLRRAFDIQITTDNLTDSEHIIQADRMRFMQILINLMSNAIKYNRKGGRVTVSVLEEKNRKVSIRIQDTGVGITEEKLESIFEPFNRLNFEFGEIEGTGIGLNITKELVERMGGTIHVKSKVNEGSSFIVSFPSTDNSATESTPEDKRIEGNELLTGEEQVKILCVEDSPINLHLIEKILKTKPNFTLLKSQTAELGIELAQKEGPDIILMDIRLPGIDGFAAFDKLRSDSRTQSIPVIAVTAHAMPEDIRKAEKMGFNAYLTKPLDVDVFFKTLEELCRKD